MTGFTSSVGRFCGRLVRLFFRHSPAAELPSSSVARLCLEEFDTCSAGKHARWRERPGRGGLATRDTAQSALFDRSCDDLPVIGVL